MGGTKESGRGGDALRAVGGMLVQREHVFAEDTLRGARNMRESLRLFALVLIVSAAMGVAAWAFLSALDAVTGFREAHLVTFALLPCGVGLHGVALS